MIARTLREKLLEMAARGTEPEKAIAAAKLAAMDARIPPPRAPTRNGAGAASDGSGGREWSWTTPNTANATASVWVVWEQGT